MRSSNTSLNQPLSFASRRDSLPISTPIFENQVLTVAEAAHLLQLSPKTVRKYARLGAIPHRRIGSEFRFLRSELIEYLKGE